MKLRGLALATSAVLAFAGAATLSLSPAQAYPAGNAMTVGLTVHDNVSAGSPIGARAYHVLRGCLVTFKLSRNSDGKVFSTKTGSARADGTTGLITFVAPSIADVYKVEGTALSCSGMEPGRTASDIVSVGHVTRGTLAVKASTSSAAKKPKITVSGGVFWGNTPIAKRTGVLVLSTAAGKKITEKYVSTDSKGKFSITLSGLKLKAGVQNAVVTFVADDASQALRLTSSITLNR